MAHINEKVSKGLLGTKLGMTQVFDEANRVVPVTVVAAGPVVVTAVRTPETDGYSAVQFAFGAIDPRKDVDGFHPANVGHLALRQFGLRPCTPRGIVELLRRHGADEGARNVAGRTPADLLASRREQESPDDAD